MSEPDFTIAWSGETAIFTLCRSAKLNTITQAVLDGLSALVDELEAGKGRGLIITGEGEKAFCAGTDLAEAASLSQEQSATKADQARALFFRINQSNITSVAAVNGLAYGGGLEIAMACTFRIGAAHARFSLPEVKLAVIPCYGGTQFLPALVGRSLALDLMLTGRNISAEEALRVGLISRLATDEAPLLEQAQALLDSVTCHSQVAIDQIRSCVAASSATVSQAGLDTEQTANVVIQQSSDAEEGVLAFLEKRRPNYQHR